MTSSMIPRWQERYFSEHFETKSSESPMFFLSGPRQAGKTFLSRKLTSRYFNWDTAEVKSAMVRDPYFFRNSTHSDPWIIFDEIHKRRDWKKLLKGYYDSPERLENFIVTGSGRFDIAQKGGDSLQGRYDLFRMMPVSFDEFRSSGLKGLASPRNFVTWEPSVGGVNDSDLQALGGFPQPLLQGSEQRLRKWLDLYVDRLVREDVRDFSGIEKLDKLEILIRLLPERLCSPISIKSLSEDVEVSQVSIKSWIKLFNTLYLGFEVPPFHKKVHRAVRKEKKFYFYQWAFARNPGARFENYLASQLLTALYAWSDQGHGRWELHYLRDQDRREIDFLITKDAVPKALIEAKSAQQPWPTGLHYYADRMKVPSFLLYPEGPTKKVGPGKWSMSSATFLRGLVAT